MYDPHVANLEHNLLFGLLAVQIDLLSPHRFNDAYTEWKSRKDTTLGSLLVQQGQLKSEERREIERLLERKLARHGGDLHSCLKSLAQSPLQSALPALADDDSRRALGLSTTGVAPPTPTPSGRDFAQQEGFDTSHQLGTGPLADRLGSWFSDHRVLVSSATLITGAIGAAIVIGVFMMPMVGQGGGIVGTGPGGTPAPTSARRPPLEQGPPLGTLDLMIRGLYDALVSQEEVLEHIKRDPALSEPERGDALRRAERYRGNPGALNSASWFIVHQPNSTPAEYKRALQLAQEAVRAAPQDGLILNTLGVAQYRAGHYHEAIETLTESDRINSAALSGVSRQQQGSMPADLAFLAMAHHQLGLKQQALEWLDKLRESVAREGPRRLSESRWFLQEAEALILGESKPQGRGRAGRDVPD